MAKVLAISSRVVRGTVGLDATVPGLQWLGHEVWALPTVQLATRPGLGRIEKREVTGAELAATFAALEADGCWPMLDAVLTGYFAGPGAVAAAADAIGHIKHANPRVVVLVDPVLGDGGRLYVAQATAEAIRDRLIPLADIATPNLFELGWLTGAVVADKDAAASAARKLGPAAVVVTSAAESAADVSTLLVIGGQCTEHVSPKWAEIPNGAGDLLAGLLLGHILNGQSQEEALTACLADLDLVLAASAGRDVLQLSALRE
jgi:pyridoxine kinase